MSFTLYGLICRSHIYAYSYSCLLWGHHYWRDPGSWTISFLYYVKFLEGLELGLNLVTDMKGESAVLLGKWFKGVINMSFCSFVFYLPQPFKASFVILHNVINCGCRDTVYYVQQAEISPRLTAYQISIRSINNTELCDLGFAGHSRLYLDLYP